MMNGHIVEIHAILRPIQIQREIKGLNHIFTVGMKKDVSCKAAVDADSETALRIDGDHLGKSMAILDVSFTITIPLNL